MSLTEEQIKTGKQNFSEAVSVTRRDFLKGVGAGAAGAGGIYFGYKQLEGEPIKTAFIGTGDEGNILIGAHPPEFMQIVAYADLRPSNRKMTLHGDGNAARPGLIKKLGEDKTAKIEAYEDHKALLADKDKLGIEAVVIAVPLNQHAAIAIECMNAGLHVMCEKLMAQNIKQCKEMIRTARKNNVLLSVGHQRHYSVLYKNAADLVHSGALGDIKFIRAQWHRNNSFPNSDQWRRRVPSEDKAVADKVKEFGYDSIEQLCSWRLYNETGGGLMAELGSHQMDAASIFLGHVHPLAVSGYGGKNFYGIPGVGPKDKWTDDRDIDDHIYVTFEFPGAQHPGAHKGGDQPDDVCIVTYSSINTNKFEPYGEWVYGSRGTIVMRSEKDALLYKEQGAGSEGGGPDQRLWVVQGLERRLLRADGLRNLLRACQGSRHDGRLVDRRQPRLYRGDGTLLLGDPEQRRLLPRRQRDPERRGKQRRPLQRRRRHGRRDYGPDRQPRDGPQAADRVQRRLVRPGFPGDAGSRLPAGRGER